jgi:hypothetical protein
VHTQELFGACGITEEKQCEAAPASAVGLRVAANRGADRVPLQQAFCALRRRYGVHFQIILHSPTSFLCPLSTYAATFRVFAKKRIDEKRKVMYNKVKHKKVVLEYE